jgi:phosphoesterase RecJ-like protein
MMEIPGIEEVAALLREGDDFLITAHVNTDGDSVASSLALLTMLTALGKDSSVVLQDPAPENFAFLPRINEIVAATEAPSRSARFAAVLDCPDLERTGAVRDLLAADVRLVNVDHHLGNTLFGSANLVALNVSSTSELLYHLAQHLELDIDQNLAELLYTGILFDTGGFRYSLATATTLEVAADLVHHGARLDVIADHVFNSSSFDQVKMMGKAIESLELAEDGRVAVLHLSEQETKTANADEAVNYGLRIRGVEVTLLLKQDRHEHYRVSLRSRAQVDVNQVAAAFGGGGHSRASGCRLDGGRQQVIDALLWEIKKQLN